ncbi:MAG: hypothetical protein J1F11_09585 [Oscillospiraceae bacterium]|nr:hypothetical protein [Oscillospiraceae bacterium]
MNNETINISALCNEIKMKCPNMELPKIKDKEQTIYLNEWQKEEIINTIIFLYNDQNKIAQDALANLINKQNNGALYELLLYSYLKENSIAFKPQVLVENCNCLKNKCDYYADGVLMRSSIYFDVKSFGMSEAAINKLREKIHEKMPDYLITIDGNLDASTKNIEKFALRKIDDIINSLKPSRHDNEKLTYYIKEIGLTICATPTKHKRASSISEFHPYKWAEENEFYFISHASQFCTNNPYIIFCPFDNKSTDVFCGKLCDNDIAFRALTRRIFMKLNHCTDSLDKYDHKARPNIKVCEAVRKLSAIVFIDVTQKHDYKNAAYTWAYINPNAEHKLSRRKIQQEFSYNGLYIDDFLYDTY